MTADQSGKDQPGHWRVHPVAGAAWPADGQSPEVPSFGRLGRGVCWGDMLAEIERYWRAREPADDNWQAGQVA